MLIDMIASSWQTINAKKKINDETSYSFTPAFA